MYNCNDVVQHFPKLLIVLKVHRYVLDITSKQTNNT